MRFIYTLFIYLYKGLISYASLFNKKAKLKIEGIKQSELVISNLRGPNSKDFIFIHCASQGEHQQALPIIRWILDHTDFNIVLSFFSPSGFKNADYNDNNRVTKIYLPFDIPSEMSSLIASIQPKKAIIIKNEWWWNMLHALSQNNIESYLVSATFRPSHYFINFPLQFFSKGLSVFLSIFVVDNESESLISKTYKGKVCLARDTRIDQVNFIKNNQINIPNDFRPKGSEPTIVYGSIWQSDLDSIQELINLYPNHNHLIFPHELDDRNIKRIQSYLKDAQLVKYVKEAAIGVNIITSMGTLKYTYRFAELAYVGGGFGVGIHNILEASVYFIPVLFGPNFEKSNEAIYLVFLQCAFVINKKEEIKNICAGINKESNRKEIEIKLKAYFSPKFSPTEIICQEIFQKKE